MAVTKKSIDVPPLDLNEGYVARHRVKVAGTVNEYESDAALDRLVTAMTAMRLNAERAHDLAEAIRSDHSFLGSSARQRFGNDAMKLYTAAKKKIEDAMDVTLAEIAACRKASRPRRSPTRAWRLTSETRCGRRSPASAARF
jgi:hypothetical protein